MAAFFLLSLQKDYFQSFAFIALGSIIILGRNIFMLLLHDAKKYERMIKGITILTGLSIIIFGVASLFTGFSTPV